MTNETPDRQGGAWIGQHPDENTEKVRENLPESAERVAVTNNESDEAPADTGSPQGHRQGDSVNDDAIREAGQNR